MGSNVDSERDHVRLVEIQDELRSWAARLHRKNHCGSASPAEPEPPVSPWVRIVVWAGLPAIALVLALLPWGIVAPPGLVVQAVPESPRPLVTAPPRSAQPPTGTPSQAHLPVAPTAAPTTLMPLRTPAGAQPPPATPAPTVRVAVGATPAPTTPAPAPAPEPAPPPLPSPATPAVTPTASSAPEGSSIPRCLGRVFLLCPPQN